MASETCWRTLSLINPAMSIESRDKPFKLSLRSSISRPLLSLSLSASSSVRRLFETVASHFDRVVMVMMTLADVRPSAERYHQLGEQTVEMHEEETFPVLHNLITVH